MPCRRATRSRWAPGLLAAALALGSAPAARGAVICIDPGHGGGDPGAVGCSLEEADINLDTALRLQALLHAASHTVLMTRADDSSVGLVSRAEYANAQGADRFVSIHSNSAASSSATGIETYCAPNAADAAFDLRDRIQEEMVSTWPLTDRGGKTANFTVLTATDMPATLSELGFIVNCDLDAQYLGDPDERQRAAGAHLRAIEAHLGNDPPLVTTGEVRGVVFEDLGSGTDDMSVRLPGAQVEVLETGDLAEAASGTAEWSFELSPGGYTFRASHPGFQPAARSCEAVRGTVSWCSLGLLPTLPDAGADDGGLDGAVVDSATVEAGADALFEVDGGGGGDSVHADDGDEVAGGCGCRTSAGVAAATLWLVAGLSLWLAARRRRASLPTTALLVLCALAVTGGARAQVPAEDARPAAVVDARRLVDGPVLGPLLAPSGERLVYWHRDRRELTLLELATGEETVVSRAPRAWLWPVWRDDSQALALRPSPRPFGGAPLRLVDLHGRAGGTLQPDHDLAVVQRGDAIVLRTGGAERELAGRGRGDRCYAPQLSPDGAWVVYASLSSGLHLYRVRDGARLELGPGNHARFGGGRFLVFDRTSDDGHRLTAGDLFVVDLEVEPGRPRRLTDTPDGIELFPSLSADGAHIAFTLDGDLYLGRAALGPGAAAEPPRRKADQR